MSAKLTNNEIIERLSKNGAEILELKDKPNGRQLYIFRCPRCGNIKSREVNPTILSRGIRSCGCNRHNWTGSKDGMIYGSHFASIKNQAKKRGYEFNITIEDLAELLRKQEYKCKYTGLSIASGNTSGGKTASLDRIDSYKGYTIDNIQWLHKDINIIKYNLSEPLFFSIVSRIATGYMDEDDNIDMIPRDYGSQYSMFGNIPLSFVSRYEYDAGKRGIEFKITGDYLWELFVSQQGKCALSGVNLLLGKPYRDSHRRKLSGTASLDRIDSSGHYEEGNVQWVHTDVNMMKLRFSNEDFLNYCKLVYEESINGI